MTAPETLGRLQWTVEAAPKDGRQRDRLVFEQLIEPAVPIETCAATHFCVAAATILPIPPHAGPLQGRLVGIAPYEQLAPPPSGRSEQPRGGKQRHGRFKT